MRTAAIILLALTATAGGQESNSQFPGRLSDPVLERCPVSSKDNLMIASRDNGALVEVNVTEGDVIEEGELLAKLDDTDAKVVRDVAKTTLATAEKNANEGADIQIDFAKKAADVAHVDYQQKVKANEGNPNTFSKIEVLRALLEWERSEAGIKVQSLNKQLAAIDVDARAAELEGAIKAVERRELTAPWGGMIVNVIRHEGEWVQAGDPILRLMNLQTMRVMGKVNASDYKRFEVANRPVTVEVELARGQKESFPGKVVFVDPSFQLTSNTFKVIAEVENRQEFGHWLLAEGAFATMTIHLE